MELWREIKRNPRPAIVGGLGYVVVLLGFAWLSQPGCLDEAGVVSFCWSWLSISNFWGSFYGNVMATTAGVVMGLPVALYLNARADATRREEQQEAEARQRQKERDAEARQRQAERETEARQRKAEREAEERDRQAEREAEARQRQAEREAEERQRQARASEENARMVRQRQQELSRFRGQIIMLRTEVLDQRLALLEAQRLMRDGLASGFRHDPVMWTALAPDVLPRFPEFGDTGIVVANRLSEFFKIMTVVQTRIDFASTVAFRDANVQPGTQNPAVSILQLAADECSLAINVAGAALPAVDSLIVMIDNVSRALV